VVEREKVYPDEPAKKKRRANISRKKKEKNNEPAGGEKFSGKKEEEKIEKPMSPKMFFLFPGKGSSTALEKKLIRPFAKCNDPQEDPHLQRILSERGGIMKKDQHSKPAVTNSREAKKKKRESSPGENYAGGAS